MSALSVGSSLSVATHAEPPRHKRSCCGIAGRIGLNAVKAPFRAVGYLGGRLLRVPAVIQRGVGAAYARCARTKHLEVVTDEMLASCQGKSKTEKRLIVQKFVADHASRLVPSSCCDNPGNRKILSDRIAQILLTHADQPEALRAQIVKNAIRNFKDHLTSSVARIKEDIKNDADFQSAFGIRPTDTIIRIQVLGCETHNKGKNPLFIELSSGKKNIYKPRSLISEKLLCGGRGSAFALVGIRGVYPVCDRGGYGYAEWLENRKEENTFASREELEEYFSQFALIEGVASFFGVSDLHQDNVITRRKCPCLIDTEVIAPVDCEAYSTNLLGDGVSGYCPASDSKNRFWMTRGISAVHEKNLKIADDPLDAFYVSREMGIHHVLFDPTAKKRTAEYLETFAGELTSLREELSRHTHRIVLIKTCQLDYLIRSNPDESFDEFYTSLVKGLNSYAFTQTVDRDTLKRQFIEDVMNNDVPVFYYCPNTGEVMYGRHVVGRKVKTEHLTTAVG